ncbi:hypothetical protein FQV39_20200 [Bosea sp. F3-2]|uniref:hypothetical protein n=1 Tax=Bosea sp. F3-2 TaxID=2599640 RepID=UPI0011EFF305|nr:hypothetical protein [Bosea sp. F3-2]QEL24648.1 hypothetical protein FQV39_20200 [Bosea sp. F3-2]
MRHAIETAPNDGHFVIIEDDANAVYGVGRWSPEAGDWVGKDDGPIKITPTHWHPARDAYLQPDDEGSVVADPVGKWAWRRFFTPVVSVIAAATILFYCVKQVAAQPPISDGIVAQETGLPDSMTALPELRRAVDRQARPPAEETQTVREQRAAATPEGLAQEAALAQELGEARRTIERLEAQLQAGSTAEQLLEQQRQKVAAALADAAAARQELTANTAQLRQALDEERARNGKMASELATAQQVNEKLVVQFRLIGQQTELRRRAYEAEVAALQQTLRQERDRAAAGAAELDATRRAAAARIQPETATSGPLSREIASTAGTAMASPAASDVQGGTEAARMIARATLLLGQGDIGAARIVLERAAELGSARAVFMLAETYDPNILFAWRTFGTRGEVARARELYAKAHAAGIREAKERFDTLGR